LAVVKADCDQMDITLEKLDKFCYLGDMLDADGDVIRQQRQGLDVCRESLRAFACTYWERIFVKTKNNNTTIYKVP